VTGPALRTWAEVSLRQLRLNFHALQETVGTGVALAPVVKADAYGHGAAAVSRALEGAGAKWLAVSCVSEGIALRQAGISIRILVMGGLLPFEREPVWTHRLTPVVHSLEELREWDQDGRALAVHLKIDTGLGRNGATPADFADLAAAALRTRSVEVVGLMSHLANADLPDDGSVREQIEQFSSTADWLQRSAGHRLQLHLANTPGTLRYPDAVFDLVRCGIGVYGVNPFEPGQGPPVDLRPAMTLRARIALSKRVPAGHGVSYGLTYRTAAASTLALVPAGYADGVPRSAGSSAAVLLAGRRRRIAGRVAMDQFVIDCGDDEVAIGDEVVLFGPGERGEPTAAEWAAACGTIGYEIVTRIGVRVPRRYLPEPEPE